MGIQINGQTDTISASDGGLNINNTGITTANDLTVRNLTGVAATFTGIVTATSFQGSGADLTNLPASGDSNDITASLFL